MTARRTITILIGAAITILGALSACVPAENETEDTSLQTRSVLRWSSPPSIQIDTSRSYKAVFTTEGGEFSVNLFADWAPVTVNSFVFLARQGYYNNTTFHRVLPGFMAQGGDPTGTGAGGPGYLFEDEFHPSLQFDRPGLLAMANRGPDTNGSQFFITYAPTRHLNGLHTIFGEVVEGVEVLESLTPRDPLKNPNYHGDTLISIEIIEADG
jgi:peptidylprolyl isomerase/peptidyl-prolyl cis-trans isomerase B (cyclophilin B)